MRKHFVNPFDRLLGTALCFLFAVKSVVAVDSIWSAVKTGDVEAINQHLADGADINARDSELGITLLSWAALFDQTEVIELLIKKGADVNAKNRDGATPLHAAAFLGRTEAAELLIQKGADVNAKNNNGETPLDATTADWETTKSIASILQVKLEQEKVKAGRAEVVKLLRQHIIKVSNVDIRTAAAEGNIEAIQQHVSSGTDLNAKEPTGGSTPLIVAAVFGQTEAARLLIEKGASVNVKNNEGNTSLHVATFFCHPETVKLLLEKSAKVNALNNRGETPLDTVEGNWNQELEGVYRFFAEILQIQLDIERIKATRPVVADILRKHGGKTGSELKAKMVTDTGLKGAYAVDGRLHVGVFGKPDSEPLTTGHQDMKPSWSKTGDMLVFFRVTKFAADVPDWKTAICVIKTDGTGFRKLTDGTHTDFNPTWTRDGTNLVVFNRQKSFGWESRGFPSKAKAKGDNRGKDGYVVMFTRHDARPGDEYAVSDTRRHSYAYSCLKDGRLLVSASHPLGYYLMTPGRNNSTKYEPIQCELAKEGSLDRISISPSETKVCFEFQRGFGEYRYPGRVLYIADFDAKERIITNPKVIANENADQNATYLYPRWTKDESAVVYHHGRGGRNQLYMYRLDDETTTRVSTNPAANYMFPHGEKSPK